MTEDNIEIGICNEQGFRQDSHGKLENMGYTRYVLHNIDMQVPNVLAFMVIK